MSIIMQMKKCKELGVTVNMPRVSEELSEDTKRGFMLLQYLKLNLKEEWGKRNKLDITKKIAMQYTKPNSYAETTRAKYLAVGVRMRQAQIMGYIYTLMLLSIVLVAMGCAIRTEGVNEKINILVFMLMGGSVIQLQLVRSVVDVLQYKKGLALQVVLASLNLVSWVVLIVGQPVSDTVGNVLAVACLLQYTVMIIYLITLGKGVKRMVEPCYSNCEVGIEESKQVESLQEVSRLFTLLSKERVTCNTWEDVLHYVERYREV